MTSPSMRREWIEILFWLLLVKFRQSPSMRREWIEICKMVVDITTGRSPSMRREWIEIRRYRRYPTLSILVSLHAEGVD